MRVKVGAGLAAVAVLLALWIGVGGSSREDGGTPTPASASTATPASTPSACAAADNCFPKPSNTGIPAGTTLRKCGSSATITTEGAVIDGCTYTGSLTISANHVTIRNSRIYGSIRTAQDDASAFFTVEDSEIGPKSGCGDVEALVGYQNYTARRNRLHGNGDGFRVAGSKVTIEDNFVLLCARPGDHSDGIQGYLGGRHVRVDHNTFDQRRAAAGANAPLFFADSSRSCTCTNNLLIAASPRSFALKINDDADPDAGPWVVTGNRMVGTRTTDNTECRAASMKWRDNRTVKVGSDYAITSTGRAVGC